MTVKIGVLEAGKRKSHIDQANPVRTERIRFRDRQVDLDVKQVPIDLPIYRMANIRTSVRQQQHLAKNRKADDFFSNGQENETAQSAQHVILADLARNSRKNIYTKLERDRQQTEPLIVTYQGVVL